MALKEFVELKARSKRRKKGVDDEELFGGDELGDRLKWTTFLLSSAGAEVEIDTGQGG